MPANLSNILSGAKTPQQIADAISSYVGATSSMKSLVPVQIYNTVLGLGANGTLTPAQAADTKKLVANPNPWDSYTSPFVNGSYVAPVAGTAGYGNALFNTPGQMIHQGGSFDFNTPGSGLWALGYDIKDPNILTAIRSKLAGYYAPNSSDPYAAHLIKGMTSNGASSADVQKFLAGDNSAAAAVVGALDAQQRQDAGAYAAKSDMGLLGTIGPMLISAAGVMSGNPWVGALAGGLSSGASTGDPIAGLLGAIGGYTGASSVMNAGGLTNYLDNIGTSVGNFLQHPLDAITGSLSDALHSVTGSAGGVLDAASTAANTGSTINGALSSAGSGIPLASAGNTFGDQIVSDALTSGTSVLPGVSFPASGLGAALNAVDNNVSKVGDALSAVKAGTALLGTVGATGLASALTPTATISSGPAVNVNANLTVDPNAAAANPDSGAAALTNAQYQLFQTKGQPIESTALADINNSNLPATAGATAMGSTAGLLGQTRGMEERTLSHFGITPTARQEGRIARNFDLNSGLTLASAFNTAASGTLDTQTQKASDALNVGRGVAGGAIQSANSAAQTAVQKQLTQNQVNAQTTSNTFSTAATGAGLGAALNSGINSLFGTNMSSWTTGLLGAGLGAALSFI